MTKQYEKRNPRELDEVGNYFSKHLNAMTGENLHSKSDMAMELGYRDMIIDTLKANLKGFNLDGTIIPAKPFMQSN